jgi:hypothetical protein
MISRFFIYNILIILYINFVLNLFIHGYYNEDDITKLAEVIPSIFNKSDFWAMLLPGYVTVILGIGLFFNTSVFGNALHSSNISFDIFSAIIFIVAGPAVGFILWQIFFHLSSFLFFFNEIRSGESPGRDIFNTKYEFERTYSQLRLVCEDNDRSELDSLQGRYVFGMSTSVGLVIIFLYAIITRVMPLSLNHPITCIPTFVNADSIVCGDLVRTILIMVLILSVGIVLFIGAYFDNQRVRVPLICKLIKKYKLGFIVTCEQWNKKEVYRRGKRACKIIKKYVKSYDEKNNESTIDKKVLEDGSTEYKIDKQALEDQLVRSDLDKRGAQKMIDALTDCNILRKEDGTNVVYVMKIDQGKIPYKKEKLDKLSIKQSSEEYSVEKKEDW